MMLTPIVAALLLTPVVAPQPPLPDWQAEMLARRPKSRASVHCSGYPEDAALRAVLARRGALVASTVVTDDLMRENEDERLDAGLRDDAMDEYEREKAGRPSREEEARRDAARRKPVITSADLAPQFSTDAFLVADLQAKEDVRVYIANRDTRLRILDEVFLKVFRTLERKLAGRLDGAPPASFSVVGVDARGGNRPVDERRTADVLSTDDLLEEALCGVTAGEGDLKIVEVVDITIAERARPGSPLAGFKTALIHTIDTDSILIELVAEARRMEANALVNTFVVFKERHKRNADGEDSPRFTLFDVSGQILYLLEELFDLEVNKVAPSLVRPAVALFVMGQAAQGTDFCGVKGLRTLEVLDACRVVCSEELHYLSPLPSVWNGDEEDLLLAEPALRRVLSLCGSTIEGISRRKVHASALKEPRQEDLLRVLWTVCYWHGREMRGVERWGFT